MQSRQMIVVQTTVGSEEDAHRLTMEVMAKQLAACCQQLSISSTYWWEGKINTINEILLTFKTVEAAWEPLEEVLRDAHPYDTPEIVALPVNNVSETYAAWVNDNTLI